MFITIIYTIFRTGSHTPADRFGLFFRCGRFISLFRCGFDPLQVNLYLSCIVIVSVLYLKEFVPYLLVVLFELFFAWRDLFGIVRYFPLFLSLLRSIVPYCSLFFSVRSFDPLLCPLFLLSCVSNPLPVYSLSISSSFLRFSFFFLESRTYFLSIRCPSPTPTSASFLSLEPTSYLFAANHQLLPPLFFLLSCRPLLPIVYLLLLLLFSGPFPVHSCCNGVGGVARFLVLRVGCCRWRYRVVNINSLFVYRYVQFMSHCEWDNRQNIWGI